MTTRDISMPLRGRVRPLPGVRVVKTRGLPEWLLLLEDNEQCNCIIDAEIVWDAICDQMRGAVPEGHFNHGLGLLWEPVREGD